MPLLQLRGLPPTPRASQLVARFFQLLSDLLAICPEILTGITADRLCALIWRTLCRAVIHGLCIDKSFGHIEISWECVNEIQRLVDEEVFAHNPPV